MTSRTPFQHEVRGALESVGPMLIGGEALPGFDVTPFRDGLGRITIPGSSIAGVLRNAASRFADPTVIENGFGARDTKRASRIEFADLILESGGWETRDGVAIDRHHGTAADRYKFDRTLVAPGARFTFSLTCLETGGDDASWSMVRRLVDELIAGRIRVGSGTTRGAGSVRLVNCETRTSRLDARSDVLGILDGSLAWSPWTRSGTNTSYDSTRASATVRFTINWRALTPVLSADHVLESAVDIVPLLREREDGLCLLLPGTSLKGALRSAIERAARSWIEVEAPETFTEQLVNGYGEWLFGSTSRRSAVAIDDVYSKAVSNNSVSAERFENDLRAQTERGDNRLSGLRKRLEKLGIHDLIPTAHVAIDRWTGGASEHRLYAVLEPHGVAWDPIEIELDIARLDRRQQHAAVGLILLAIDSLQRTRGPLGFGGNQGLGSIEISSVAVTGPLEHMGLGGLDTMLAEYRSPLEGLASRESLRETLRAAIDEELRENARQSAGEAR